MLPRSSVVRHCGRRSGDSSPDAAGRAVRRIAVATLSLIFLLGCGLVPSTTPSAVPSTTVASPAGPLTPLAPQLTPTPGLLLYGRVRLSDGSGLAGVSICRNYASYPGTIIATSDRSGYFQAAFGFIPGDEMVGVWAVAPGYAFDPPIYRWRHYFGVEDRALEFLAIPSTAPPAPPAPCS